MAKTMKSLFLIFVFGFLLLNVTNHSFAQSEQVVVLETTSGNIVIEFFPEDAPKTVDNFLNLAESGFYDGIIFHRIIKDFMIQGGDPLSKVPELKSQWGTGDAGQNIEAEFNSIKHNRGIVSMARSAHPDSASSQFFIVHGDSNFLDEQYTVFGRIVTQESFDTLDKIASLEKGAKDVPIDPEQAKILTAKVVQRSEISDLLELNEPERVLTSTPTIQSTETESEFVPYVNNRLGISLLAPTGWLVQEPQKTSPDVPDIVFIGSKVGEINPIISIAIMSTEGKTLQQIIDERRATIQPVIDEGDLEIISDEMGVINGREAWIVQALGVYPSGSNLNFVKFAEVMIHTYEKIYIITYTNDEEDFETHKVKYEKVIDSFSIQGDSTQSLSLTSEDKISQEEGGGCLIATATFGSELAPQVQQLRELRDETVLQTESGTAFMKQFNQFYYSFSPTIADLERENPVFKEAVKVTITPLLATLSILNHVDIDSEQEMLGYGIGIILMNIGMYFVAPTVVIHRLRK
jgi:peptidyl-prolyl cis-trans isomerase B (cyclophilin B)